MAFKHCLEFHLDAKIHESESDIDLRKQAPVQSCQNYFNDSRGTWLTSLDASSP